MKKTKSQLNTEFKKKFCRRFEIYFHKEKEKEVLAYFETIKNKQQYIKNLIINEMKNS